MPPKQIVSKVDVCKINDVWYLKPFPEFALWLNVNGFFFYASALRCKCNWEMHDVLFFCFGHLQLLQEQLNYTTSCIASYVWGKLLKVTILNIFRSFRNSSYYREKEIFLLKITILIHFSRQHIINRFLPEKRTSSNYRRRCEHRWNRLKLSLELAPNQRSFGITRTCSI